MCFGGGGKQKPPKQFTPAAAPAPPLGIAEEPDIGERRRRQNISLFGKDTPTYRHREEDQPTTPVAKTVTPNGGLRM